MKKVVDILKEIVDTCSYKKDSAVIYGEGLRKIICNEQPQKIDIHIKSKKKLLELEEIYGKFENSLIKIHFGSKIETSPFTMNTIQVSLDELLNKTGKITPVNATKDIEKRITKFTKEAKENLRPNYILDVIVESQQNNFNLDANTIEVIFKNRNLVNRIEKRKIYNFIKTLATFDKPRKIIANLNALGISQELFNEKLVESPFVNHLKPLDYFEFMYLIFNNIELENLEEFLVNKVGFHLRDSHFVVNLYKAISEIESEDETQARKFLACLGTKQRLPNVLRLLKFMGFKKLAQNIKSQKDAPIFRENLCIDESILKAAFNIKKEDTLDKLMVIARNKIIDNPEFNDKYKILTYLNKERGLLWQEEDEKREVPN